MAIRVSRKREGIHKRIDGGRRAAVHADGQFLIDDGAIFGMQSFTQSLIKLVRDGKITEEDAALAADNRDEFMLVLKGIRKS